MDLTEMKNLWQQQEQKLDEGRLLSERMIGQMIRQSSRNVLRRLEIAEYTGIATCLLVLTVLLLRIHTLGDLPEMMAAYIVSILGVLAALALGAANLKQLQGVDFSRDSVVESMLRIARFRQSIARQRIVVLITAPILILALYTLGLQWVHHQSILADVRFTLRQMGLAIALFVPAVWFLSQKIYFHSLDQLGKEIREINDFHRE